MSLKLYTHPMSRGRIARWILEESGLDYETEIVPYGPVMKGDTYRQINPMGKVPALAHNGAVITEVAAICTYIAETFPEADLGTRTDAERANFLRWMFFAAGPLEQAVTNRAMGFQVPDDRRGQSGYGSYELVLDTLEQAVCAHPFIAGERFTAADVYVGSHIGWGLRFNSIERRPAFADYFARLSSRDGFKRANGKDDEAMTALQG